MIVAVPPLRSILNACSVGHLQADRFERVVHAAAGHRDDFADRVGLLRVDDVGGAELAREFELTRHRVDRDDAARAGDRRAVDARQADAAAADHRNRRARFDLRGVDHRADAGRDAAADQRRAVERHVGADLHDGVFVHQHVLGERRQVQELEYRLSRLRSAAAVRPSSRSRSSRSHSDMWPVRQYSQWPQNADRHVIT